jgi:hypothetical protein
MEYDTHLGRLPLMLLLYDVVRIQGRQDAFGRVENLRQPAP